MQDGCKSYSLLMVTILQCNCLSQEICLPSQFLDRSNPNKLDVQSCKHSLYYYLHHHQNFQYSNSPAPSSALYSNITHCHHRNRHISEEQSSPVSSLPWPSLLPWPSTPLSSTPHGNHHMVITCISKPDMRGVITWPESIGCFRGCRRRLF